MTNQEREIRAFMTNLGFSHIQTGGGCTAYAKHNGDGTETLITDGDLGAPESLSDSCVMSRVHEGGEIVSEEAFESVRKIA